MDFQAVARPHSFRAQLEENENFATKVLYPGSNTGCVSTVSKKFIERPRRYGSLVERTRDGKDIWMLVSLSL